MTDRIADNCIVVTGAPGAGKTTLLDCVHALGRPVVAEAARQILAEQRSFGGRAVPEHDPGLFVELLLSRALYEYHRHAGCRRPVLFDRGLPDVIAYARLFGLPDSGALAAARRHRYNRLVFLLPAHEGIYRQDDERKMTFTEARDFGETIREVYEELGYAAVAVPAGTPDERASALLAQLPGQSSS